METKVQEIIVYEDSSPRHVFTVIKSALESFGIGCELIEVNGVDNQKYLKYRLYQTEQQNGRRS